VLRQTEINVCSEHLGCSATHYFDCIIKVSAILY